jgi:phage tail-like protein
MMGTKADPLVSFHFSLDLQGSVSGYFMEVSGVGSENEITEHKVMGDNGTAQIVKKIPGRLKWTDITLKRGITDAMDMWTWRKQVTDGQVEAARKNGSIIMYDHIGTIVAQWDFVRGWPSKITGPSIKSDDNAVGVEELTISHEGITRTK